MLAEHPVEVSTRVGMEELQTIPNQEEDVAFSDKGASSMNSSQSVVSEGDASGNDGSMSETDTEDDISAQEAPHELGSSRSNFSMSVTTLNGPNSVIGSASCSRCKAPECDLILPEENLSRRSQGAEPSETVLRPSRGVTTTRTGRVIKPVKRLLESMRMIIKEPGSTKPLSALFTALSTFVEV